MKAYEKKDKSRGNQQSIINFASVKAPSEYFN